MIEHIKAPSVHRVWSADSLFAGKGTHRSGSNSSEDDMPLSMRFMHKPLRANEQFCKAIDVTSDVTRRNSLRNAVGAIPETPTATLPKILPPNGRSSVSEKIQLVRKKSGEIVKPLLKESFLSAKNRSRSLPSTPTYKQVHFGGDNDVRYFKLKDKPTAILTFNLPTLFPDDDDMSLPDLDDYSLASDSDADRGFSLLNPYMSGYFDYNDDELNLHLNTFRGSPHLLPGKYGNTAPKPEWELHLVNFPLLSYHTNIMLCNMRVFLERVFLSVDTKYLLGQVAVKNFTYEKKVTVRYTLDNWATIVEIPCMYVLDVLPVLKAHNYDRFVFKTPIDTFFNGFGGTARGGATCQLCVKFSTPDAKYWDNNDGKNYLFRLRQTPRPPLPAPRAAKPSPAVDLPQAAKTKQDAHIRKPKYSLSYLKKKDFGGAQRAFDATKGIANEEPGNAQEPVPAVRNSENSAINRAARANADGNDFVLNNYYLLSPLFSSLSNKDEHVFLDGALSQAAASGRPTSAAAFSPAALRDDSVSPNRDVSESPVVVPRNTNDHLQSMSYKELLESYCFFTPPADSNASKTTSVMSDEPDSNYKENLSSSKSIPSTNSRAVFTVSSFLKN